MNATFSKLKKLQPVLVTYFDIKKQLETLPKELADKEAMLARYKEENIQNYERGFRLQEKLDETNSALKKSEAERIVLENKLENVTTQKEFENIQAEIEHQKKVEQNARSLRLSLQQRLASNKEKTEEAGETLGALEQQITTEKQEIEAKLESLKKELEAIEPKREKLSQGIEPNVLFKFERIIKRGGEGSATVQGRVCKGCNMELPIFFVNRVRKEETVEFCPYCSKVLFYKKGREDEEAIGDYDMKEVLIEKDFNEEEAISDEYTDDGDEAERDSNYESDYQDDLGISDIANESEFEDFD